MRNKLKYLVSLLCFVGITASSQKAYYDSLVKVLESSLPDSARFHVLMSIGNYLETEIPDSAFYFHNKAMIIAQKRNDEFMIGYVLKELGGDHYNLSE